MANIILTAGQVQALRTALQRGSGFNFDLPLTGSTGATGPQGPVGPGVPAGGTTGQVLVKLSNANYDTAWQTLAVPLAGGHVDVTTPQTTTSATLVDIPGLEIQLTNTVACKYFCALTASIDTTGPGGAATAAYAISIDGSDQDEQHIDFAVVALDETAATIHISGVLAPGLHTFKGRYRRVSGTQTVEFNTGTLTAFALQATP